LTGRILERLTPPLKDVVRWGILLRRFNQDILAHTLPEAIPAIDDDTYERLRRYSFVAPARVGAGLACHDLLRQVQNGYLRTHKPAAYREFHTRAASYFAEQNDLIETLYHRLMAGDDKAPQAWYDAVHTAYLYLHWPIWAALLDVAERPEQRPSRQHRAEVTFWRGQWHRWRYENEAALDSYRQALDLFRAVGDRLGEANTLKAIGDVQRFKDENEAALDSYRQALDLFRAIGSRLGEANTLQAIGFMKLDAGDGAAGSNALNEALALYRQVGDRVGQANTYWGLGIRLAQSGNLQQAESLIAQTLELVEQFIPDHPFTAQVKTVLEQIRNLLNEQG
jgi:tetratricopeptide (TPR) repeat protein